MDLCPPTDVVQGILTLHLGRQSIYDIVPHQPTEEQAWGISLCSSFQSESWLSQFFTSVCLDPLSGSWCETELSFGLKEKREKMDTAAARFFLPLLHSARRINSQWTSDGWEAVAMPGEKVQRFYWIQQLLLLQTNRAQIMLFVNPI